MSSVENYSLHGRWLQYKLCPPGGSLNPGYWYRGSYSDAPLQKLFTVTILTEQGQPAHLAPAYTSTDPEKTTTTYTSDLLPGIRIQETRFVTDEDTAISIIDVTNTSRSPVKVNVIVRTVLQSDGTLGYSHVSTAADVATWMSNFDLLSDNALQVPGETRDSEPATVHSSFWLSLGASRLADSRIQLTTLAWPDCEEWTASPISEYFTNHGFRFSPVRPPEGIKGLYTHLGYHYTIEMVAGERDTLVVGLSLATQFDAATNSLREGVALALQGNYQVRPQDQLNSPAQVRASDPRYEKLTTLQFNILRRYVLFEQVTNLSEVSLVSELAGRRLHVAAHLGPACTELAAANNPHISPKALRTFLQYQRSDGSLPASVGQFRGAVGEALFDAGSWLLHLLSVNAPREDIQAVYYSLGHYAHYLNRRYRSPITGLYQPPPAIEEIPHFSTQSNAEHTVGATVANYRLLQSLATTADFLNMDSDRSAWSMMADTTATSVSRLMWDEDLGFFVDYDEETSRRSSKLYADGFLPLGTDIASPHHACAWAHLANNATFGCPYGIPSAAQSNVDFTSDGVLQGIKQRSCWEGPAWAIQNIEILNALMHYIRGVDGTATPMALSLLNRLLEIASGENTGVQLPSSWNPLTGAINTAGGKQIPQEWSLNSVILSALVGIGRPDSSGNVVIDPLPVDVHWFTVDNVMISGSQLAVIWEDSNGFRVLVNRREVHASSERTKVTVRL